MKTSSIYKKHLNLSKRIQIEQCLNEGKNFIQIGELVNKASNTIAYEVKKHRQLVKCIGYGRGTKYDFNCSKTSKPPYVCNGCPSRSGCRKNRYYYYAEDANREYEELLSESRQGIDMDTEDFHRLKDIVRCEIDKGHSFSMIINNHTGEFNIGKRTLYNYQEKGYLGIKNIDLPRKVRYKKRVKKQEPIIHDSKVRVGRTYQDFLYFKDTVMRGFNNYVEMDTVEGIKGHSVLLTFLFKSSNFLLAFKLEKQNSECVSNFFINVKNNLGYLLFRKIFPVILTDNGSEFKRPSIIEHNGDDVKESNVFYCDPGHSEQKGSLEVTHEYIRRFFPKGTDFDKYSVEDINLMINHINSVPREKFINKTPYEIMSDFIDDKFLTVFNLYPIEKTEVILNKNLFKKNNTNK